MKERLNEYIKLTEENLKKYTSNKAESPRNLIDAMNYSLEAGGKRIRPVLTFEFCRACGGDINDVIAPACAIEMIHTFSLIHDDLPAMDNDDMRRGKPSCHKAFNEAAAILAGDALSVLPFGIIADDKRLSNEKKIGIISVLAKATDSMIDGQILDMEYEGGIVKITDSQSDKIVADIYNNDASNKEADCPRGLPALRFMYLNKTGALIMASCVMGCIGAGADESKISAASAYAYKLGLAFQVVDDILDVEGNPKETGKPVGSDEKENKTTFVTLCGIEKAKEIAKELTEEALALLDEFDDNAFLKELTAMLLIRNK